MAVKAQLICENLSCGYGRETVVSGVDLSIARGEICAVIGPNGAGKSTLLKTVGGIIAPMGGNILIDGRPLSDIPRNARAKTIALMLTSGGMRDRITCFEMAALGRHPYTGRLGVLSEDDREKVREALRLTETLELSDAAFDRLSDGQRQRVLLARAIAQEPELMILDEPASYLDIYHKLRLLDIIRALSEERGIAVLMSVHEPELAWQAADRIFSISAGGRLIFSGEPDEAVTDENLSRLYGLKRGQLAALYRGFSGSIDSPGAKK